MECVNFHISKLLELTNIFLNAFNFFFAEKNPISYNGKSYARYSLTNPFERHLSIAISVRTVQATGNLMYASGIRDYSILEVIFL